MVWLSLACKLPWFLRERRWSSLLIRNLQVTTSAFWEFNSTLHERKRIYKSLSEGMDPIRLITPGSGAYQVCKRQLFLVISGVHSAVICNSNRMRPTFMSQTIWVNDTVIKRGWRLRYSFVNRVLLGSELRKAPCDQGKVVSFSTFHSSHYINS